MGLLNLIPPDNKLGQLLMGFQQPLNDLGVGLSRGKTWQKGIREASEYTEDQAPLRAEQAQLQMKAQNDITARNKTAAYLRSQPGGAQFADAIENGMIDGSTAFKSWLDASKGQTPQNPYMSAGDGQFLNWQTGEFLSNPNAQPDLPNPPQNYRWAADGQSLEAIPGGPADTKSGLTDDRKMVATDTILTAADSARKLVDAGANTGVFGAVMGVNPESQAAELRRQVDVLKSNASIENLTAMRQASPTGGALGSVTEKENAMLASAAGALNPDAGAEDFKRALDNYELTLLSIVHGPQVGRQIFDQTRASAPNGGVDADVENILQQYGVQ